MDLSQRIRPQNKIVGVNDRLGNNFIKSMQGTTKMIYDTLPFVPGQNIYEFFQGTGQRSFPFTNVKGDQLEPGDSLAIQRVNLSVVEINAEGSVVRIASLEDLGATEQNLKLSDLEISIANDVVMKPIAIQNFSPSFNKNSNSDVNTNFEMNTNLVIPPQLNFKFSLRCFNLVLTPGGEGNALYLRMIAEGVGSQFNGKTNF